MDRMKDMLPRIAQQRARASRQAQVPPYAAPADPTDAVLPAPQEPTSPPRTGAQSGTRPVRTPARPGVPATRVVPTAPRTPASARSSESRQARQPSSGAPIHPTSRATPPVERGPLTPRTLPQSGGVARSASRPPIPPADVLESDRILELPASRRTRTSQANPAEPSAPSTRGSTLQGRTEIPARSLPRRSEARMADRSSTQSLGEALQGYVAVLAERRKLRQAGLDDQGRPVKAARAPLKSEQEEACPLCGGAGWLRIDVPFGDPRFGQPVPCKCKEQEIEERHQREEERRMAELDRFFSLQPFMDKTFDTFDAKVPGLREGFVVARSYAEDPQGWLLLMGGYGTGKTHLAAAIAHERLAAGSSVYFAVVPELLDHLRSAFAPGKDISYDEMFDKIREVELLVLDDLGAENGTAWATEKLFQLINYRYNYRMPTVLTTNNQLQTRMDDRVRSRLNDLGLVQHLIINAKDYRPRNARGAARG